MPRERDIDHMTAPCVRCGTAMAKAAVEGGLVIPSRYLQLSRTGDLLVACKDCGTPQSVILVGTEGQLLFKAHIKTYTKVSKKTGKLGTVRAHDDKRRPRIAEATKLGAKHLPSWDLGRAGELKEVVAQTIARKIAKELTPAEVDDFVKVIAQDYAHYGGRWNDDYAAAMQAWRNKEHTQEHFLWCKAVANWSLGTWARTSGDHVPPAVAMQFVAEKMFQDVMPSAPQTAHLGRRSNGDSHVILEARTFATSFEKPLASVMTAMYESTQEFFKQRKIKYVTVYRGMGTKDVPDGLGDVHLQPLSSCSASIAMADHFSHEAAEGESRTLIALRVPVKQVIATYKTGFGCRDEQEVVVAGGMHRCVTANDTDRKGENLRTKLHMEMARLEIEAEARKKPKLAKAASPHKSDWPPHALDALDGDLRFADWAKRAHKKRGGSCGKKLDRDLGGKT